jgi:predicted house-cleaning noncanonical NTP pyrophosphatase (MazG superfamily)
MSYLYQKLVRDRIPEILDTKGVPYEKRIADDAEYRAELIKKLQEEAREFVDSNGAVEELADVLEVVRALATLPEYTHLEEIRHKKASERGAFEKRYVLKGEK